MYLGMEPDFIKIPSEKRKVSGTPWVTCLDQVSPWGAESNSHSRMGQLSRPQPEMAEFAVTTGQGSFLSL